MDEYILIYDKKLMRPACVLLQVMLGGTLPTFSEDFIGTDWLVNTTPDMKAYRVTAAEAKKAAALSVKR